MPKNRYVENELQRTPEVHPAVSPVDNFAYVQGARMTPSLTDFQGLSKSLNESLLGINEEYAVKQNELGAADFEKQLADAEASSGSLSEAFAKALSSGAINESDNPYFRTGARKAAARQLATRGFGEGSEEISNWYSSQAQVNPQTGVAPVISSPAHVETKGEQQFIQKWKYTSGPKAGQVVDSKPP